MRYRIVKDKGRLTYEEVAPKYIIEHIVDNEVTTLLMTDRSMINFMIGIAEENGDNLFDFYKTTEINITNALQYLNHFCENLKLKTTG